MCSTSLETATEMPPLLCILQDQLTPPIPRGLSSSVVTAVTPAFSELGAFTDVTVHRPMTHDSKTNYTRLTSWGRHSSGQDSGSLNVRRVRTDEKRGNKQITDGAKCCDINHQSSVTE